MPAKIWFWLRLRLAVLNFFTSSQTNFFIKLFGTVLKAVGLKSKYDSYPFLSTTLSTLHQATQPRGDSFQRRKYLPNLPNGSGQSLCGLSQGFGQEKVQLTVIHCRFIAGK